MIRHYYSSSDASRNFLVQEFHRSTLSDEVVYVILNAAILSDNISAQKRRPLIVVYLSFASLFLKCLFLFAFACSVNDATHYVGCVGLSNKLVSVTVGG